MDKAVHTEKHNTYTLKNVLIVDFIEAIENNDKSLIGEDCTIENFNNLYIDYEFEIKDKSLMNGIEKQIEDLEKQHFTILKLAMSLFNNSSDEIILMLNNYGYKITKDYNELDLDKIIKDNELKSNRIKLLKGKLQQVVKTNKDNKNIYLVISELSLACGFDLDYKSLTIMKFISYIKSLKNRDE